MPAFITFKTFLRNLVPRFPIFFGIWTLHCTDCLKHNHRHRHIFFNKAYSQNVKPEIPDLMIRLGVLYFRTQGGKLISALFLWLDSCVHDNFIPSFSKLPNSAQAKPKLNSNLAELALFSENPTTHPHPPTHPGKFISKPAWGKS